LIYIFIYLLASIVSRTAVIQIQDENTFFFQKPISICS